MRKYVKKSLSNDNKRNGILAEAEFRMFLTHLGMATKASPGGWIMRSARDASLPKRSFVAFPNDIEPDRDYTATSDLAPPPHGMQAVASVFHQHGIEAFAAGATIAKKNDAASIQWYVKQLGLPHIGPWEAFPGVLDQFVPRTRKYNFLRYSVRTKAIPDKLIPDVFAKEHLRIAVQNNFFVELSDVDAVFFGKHRVYPVEIKEKTRGADPSGEFFGLDVGPFVKLAFYTAHRNDMDSVFVVREIEDTRSRRLKAWWIITFDEIARVAGWTPISGGKSMGGGRSSVIKIPFAAFRPLNAKVLASL
jgi:hypothetical protein